MTVVQVEFFFFLNLFYHFKGGGSIPDLVSQLQSPPIFFLMPLNFSYASAACRPVLGQAVQPKNSPLPFKPSMPPFFFLDAGY